MNPAIALTNVSKSFSGERASLFSLLMRRSAVPRRATKSVIDDVSFTIMPGERVALMGQNGAGKSTLLKIISRILQPDHGHVAVHGRVASLLELGIGFHPELTGAENVYFYGAVMGMRRHEVSQIFDEICAFADIGDFINQPVKVYSSGMYQRLAFASAFATRPDILIADEGLSVGDMAFQQKCFDRIESLTDHGTTILVVAHSISSLLRITDRALWLDNGNIRMDDSVHVVAEAYSQYMARASEQQRLDGGGNQPISNQYVRSTATMRVIRTAVRAPSTSDTWDCRQPLQVEAVVEIDDPVFVARVNVRLVTAAENMFVVENDYMSDPPMTFTAGQHLLQFTFPAMQIRPSLYRFVVHLLDESGQYRLVRDGTLFIQVVNPNLRITQESFLVNAQIQSEMCS
jgi:ABC-type polysaccharide/polyol phosphate transport system ATPase subunit